MIKLRFSTCTLIACLCFASSHVWSEESRHGLSYAQGELCGYLKCQDVRESSGVAASKFQDGVFWTHNDSGNQPRLFAFHEDGTHLGSWPVEGAKVRDWEDMASFKRNGQALLLIADTGDNLKRRKSYLLYIVVESLPAKGESLKILRTIQFEFETGSHDCEAVAYDAELDQIILVTKGWRPHCEVHVIPWDDDYSDDNADATVRTTKKIADLEIAGITGLDISPTGHYAVASTYGGAYIFVREPGESWADGFARSSQTVAVPPRKQGESVCFDHDEISLVLTSEQLPTPVFRIVGKVEQSSNGLNLPNN